MDLTIDDDIQTINNDDNANSSTVCMECSQIVHTEFGVKLHRELHQNYATFNDKYEKV